MAPYTLPCALLAGEQRRQAPTRAEMLSIDGTVFARL